MRYLFLLSLFVLYSCSSDSENELLPDPPVETPGEITLYSSISTLTSDLPVEFIRVDKPIGGSYPIDYIGAAKLSALISKDNNTISFENAQLYPDDGGYAKFVGWYPQNGTWDASTSTITFPVLDGTTDILISPTVEGNEDNPFTAEKGQVVFNPILTQVRVFVYLEHESYKNLWGNLASIEFVGKAQTCTLRLPDANAGAGNSPEVDFSTPFDDLSLQKLSKDGAVSDIALTVFPADAGSAEPIGYAMFAPHTSESDRLILKVTTAKGGTQELSIPYDEETMSMEAGKSYDIYLSFGITDITPLSTIEDWSPENKFTLGMPSNCYILKPGGYTVAIPVSRANEFAQQLGEDEAFTASILWNDGSAGLVTLSRSAGTGYEDYICVTSNTDESKVGNAVVTLNRAGGSKEVLWSWHIWVTDYEPDINATFMDRYLGATSANPEDGTATFGLYYQWGRKDPFPRNAGITTDSGEEPVLYTESGSNFPFSMSEDNLPALGYATRTASGTQKSVEWSIQNPVTFIANFGSWYLGSTSTDDLWGDKTDKTLYDPCPTGWRIPQGYPWSSLTKSNFPWNSTYQGRSNSSCGGWYPATGIRHSNDGELRGVNEGICWHAKVNDSKYAYILRFDSSNVSANGWNASLRAGGCTVRCVPE